jgi:hypothetical protein
MFDTFLGLSVCNVPYVVLCKIIFHDFDTFSSLSFASYMVLCRFHYVVLLVFACFTIYFWFFIFCCFTSILNSTSFIFTNEREYQPLTKSSM